jgi:hypothetical protein
MNDRFAHLNGSDALLPAPADESAAGAARRRVLSRLGSYTALLVGPLNMRPIAATLLSHDDERVAVRVSSSSSHILLVIAPAGDLAAEVFFLRALAGANLPIPRLISHDLSCAAVPFSYALESYASGMPLDQLADAALVRIAARQVGRTLRRAHRHSVPGFGRPTASGRWPARTWRDTLYGWLDQQPLLACAEQVLGPAAALAWRAATLEHRALACDQPNLLHGAIMPASAIVTIGDGVQLEALTRPGAIIGGDPLFDLAHGLLPRHPAAFRQGLLEGYTASGALAPEQQRRLERLRLLLSTADTLAGADAAALARLPDDLAVALAALDSRSS